MQKIVNNRVTIALNHLIYNKNHYLCSRISKIITF